MNMWNDQTIHKFLDKEIEEYNIFTKFTLLCISSCNFYIEKYTWFFSSVLT